MPSFRVDVKIYGTAYVEAENAEAARELIIASVGTPDDCAILELAERDIRINNGVTLSPMFTAYGMAEGADVEEA